MFNHGKGGFMRVLAVVLVVVLAAGCSTGSKKVSSTAPASTPVVAAPNQIDLAKYDQIQEGMTYEQVVSIVGNPGTTIGKGENSLEVEWLQDNKESYADCFFVLDKLTSKTQSGLH
jgi:methionine-rich copper-binding protein CopC